MTAPMFWLPILAPGLIVLGVFAVAMREYGATGRDWAFCGVGAIVAAAIVASVVWMFLLILGG